MSVEPLPEPPPSLLKPPATKQEECTDDDSLDAPVPPEDPPVQENGIDPPERTSSQATDPESSGPSDLLFEPVETALTPAEEPQVQENGSVSLQETTSTQPTFEPYEDMFEEPEDEDAADFQDCTDESPDYDQEDFKTEDSSTSEYDFQFGKKDLSARRLVHYLHKLSQNCSEEQMQKCWRDIEQMTEDPEPAMRIDLLEHMCVLSGVCMNRQTSMSPVIACGSVIPMPPQPLLVKLNRMCIIPALATLMRDQVMPVRKTAQCVVFRMIESRLIPPQSIIKDILPSVIIMARTSLEHSDEAEGGSGGFHDPRQEAASYLAKLVQYVDIVEAQKRFLPPFLRLCNDPSFQVRRVCALVMVELCQALGAPCVQNSLLTTFLALCEDDAWTVRKSCTESFMAISCVVEPKLRLEALAPRFLCLLRDVTKWTVASAYQNLGLFISTFADPKRTGLELVRPDGLTQEASVRRTSDYRAPTFDPAKAETSLSDMTFTIYEGEFSSFNDEDSTNNNYGEVDSKPVNSRKSDINFNSFLYWRPPFPEITELEPKRKESKSEISMEEKPEKDATDQDTQDDCGIPLELLKYFRHMTDEALSKTVDCFDLPHNCAYSLPAVALALGPKHWERHLKSLIQELSVNVQWKVRHSIASSVHNLVIIVGDRDAVLHLIPIIMVLSEDLDEIRLPLLRNLHQIVAYLEVETRARLLPVFSKFAIGGTERIWRIRDELANQIRLTAPFYDFETRVRFFMEIILHFLTDKVAQVRTSAALCFGPIVWSPNISRAHGAEDSIVAPKLMINGCGDAKWSQAPTHDPNFKARSHYEMLELVLEGVYRNRNWRKWQHRQTFARVLRSIIEDCPADVDMLLGASEETIRKATEGLQVCESSPGIRNMAVIVKLIKPEIQELLHHNVANVRLEVANVLRSISMRSNEILLAHRAKCQKCRTICNDSTQKARSSGRNRKKRRRKNIQISIKNEDSADGEKKLEMTTLSAAMQQMSTETKKNSSDSKSSDSDSSRDSCSRGQYELLTLVGLGELPQAFEVLLNDGDLGVASVTKEALKRFMEDPDRLSCSDSGSYRINR